MVPVPVRAVRALVRAVPALVKVVPVPVRVVRAPVRVGSVVKGASAVLGVAKVVVVVSVARAPVRGAASAVTAVLGRHAKRAAAEAVRDAMVHRVVSVANAVRVKKEVPVRRVVSVANAVRVAMARRAPIEVAKGVADVPELRVVSVARGATALHVPVRVAEAVRVSVGPGDGSSRGSGKGVLARELGGSRDGTGSVPSRVGVLTDLLATVSARTSVSGPRRSMMTRCCPTR